MRLVSATACCTLSVLAGGGCVGPTPRPDTGNRIKAATGISGGAVAFHSNAERDDAGEHVGTISLDSAVRLAVEHDPRIQAAAARVKVALADAGQARLLPNPVLSVAVMFPEGGGKPVVNAGLSADLLSLLTRARRASAADQRVRAASAEAVRAALDVVAEVQERYASVQALDERVAVLRQRQSLVGRLLDLAETRLRAGEAGRLDVITLDAERVTLEADLIERAGELRDQRLALARLIGRPGDAADWSVAPWVPDVGPVVDERAWVATALRNRPEIQAQFWELAALGDEAALADWAALDGGNLGASAQRDPEWAVGPAVSTPIPLLDWGQAKRARAEAARVEGRHKMTQVRRQVIEEVRRAYAALASADAAVSKVRDELVPLQDRRREQAESAYKAGAADITAVLLAEQQSQEVRERLIDLQQKLATANGRLRRVVGGSAAAGTVSKTTTRPTSSTRP